MKTSDELTNRREQADVRIASRNLNRLLLVGQIGFRIPTEILKEMSDALVVPCGRF